MENKQSFEELKNEILEKAKAADACDEGYKYAENAENEKELLDVISEYLGWCIENGVVTREYLNKFELQNLIDAGLANTGKENTGISNSGDRNSGNRNSGNWNSGNRNSGDSNSGYRNSGAFCTDNNPRVKLFDVETDMGVREWENHPAYRLMAIGLNFNFWVRENEMNDSEKEKYPSYKTTGGYLKTIPYKEGWANFWGNLSDENKKVFTSLPNFDPDKFKYITGIKTN